ncbi:DNA topoisomerase IB [Streptomyces sp. CA-142005]|uniref:DNA topoisomerase IB n=1 Tax=Streptomyces sp. CA-142005 TaxID=3240052 RepID=UPI003D93DE8F
MRLRTSSCDGPGYRRIRCGRGFRYADTAGRPLTDPAELARIRALTIPPAWRDVWICPWPGGHLQAVGTDDAGRRQYLYHEQFRAEQEKAEHEHVRQVARTLPELRGKVAADLTGRGLTPSRVTACAVRLLDLGFFRIGSDRHTRFSETYGLTTMLREHVSCGRGEITFSHPAKGGVETVRALVDDQVRIVARALLRRPDGGDRFLASYARGLWHDLHSDDLNEALRRLSVCRSSSIDPAVFELFEDGVTIAPVFTRLGEHGDFGRPATQGAVEAAVLDLLDGFGG